MNQKLFSGLIIGLLLITSACVQGSEKIEVMTFSEFEPDLHVNNDTIYIVNFWATWCAPCRKELPGLEKIHLNYLADKVKVLLVSLDFASEVKESLIPFLKSNKITADVILLNDPNSNSWIDKVDPSWSGSLPATLIYKGNNRQFFERELNYEFLKSKINEFKL